MTSEKAWSSALLEEVVDVCRTNIEKWCRTVESLGLSSNDLDMYKKVVVDHIRTLLDEMNQEVEEMQGTVMDEIEHLLQTSAQLCKQLSIKMPEYGKDNLGFYQERNLLQQKIAEYEALRNIRLKEIERLENQEKLLCKCLGRSPKGLQECPLPSQKRIALFENYLEELEREKFERMEKFCTIKTEILQLVAEIGVKPFLDIEKAVVERDDAEFLVTDSNMELLENFHESLKKQLTNYKEEIDVVSKKIEQLWNILETDIQERDAFRNKCVGNLIDKLNILKKELKKCEVLKRENIQTFIEKLRKEMTELWDKVQYTQQQRDEFQFFNTSIYTEDLLEIHERELQKLKNLYTENSDIYALLEKYKDLWQKMKQLEKGEEQPNRYKNRGGQLLKEEKERNKLSKQIPLVEEKLLKFSADYYHQHGKPFLTWGLTINDYINHERDAQKEERILRMSAKKQQRELTIIPSTSCARTPNTASKRKNTTPMYTAEKRSKLDLFKKGQGTNTAPVGTSKLSFRPNSKIRTSLERIKKRRRHSRRLNDTEDFEYSTFERNLQPNSRSTMCLNMDGEQLAKPLKQTPTKKVVPRMKLTTPGGKMMSMKI